MAKKFLSVGAEVLITGRNAERLKQVYSELINPKLHILKWDVSDMNVMGSKFDEAIEILGGCDILVNNAAFLQKKQTDLSFFDKTMNTNCRAVYFMCQKAVDFF